MSTETPQPKKTVPVEKRCYKVNEIPHLTKMQSHCEFMRVKLNKTVDAIVKQQRIGTQPIAQKDLSSWTFDNKDRKEYMKTRAAAGKGHSFWTDKERGVFQAFFASSIKRGAKISKLRVNKCIDSDFKLNYPCYIASFDDKKIRESIYRAVNNMAKKRLTFYGKIVKPDDDLDMGRNAVMYLSQRKYAIVDWKATRHLSVSKELSE